MSDVRVGSNAVERDGDGGSGRSATTWLELRSEDRMLALVRAAVVAGSGVWTALAPIETPVRIHCAVLLGVFLVYGGVLLVCVSRWRRWSRHIYLVALIADLTLLYFLFRKTGGIASPFLPAAFMLSALTAFHYGPALGVLAACAAFGLAMLGDVGNLSLRHWSELPLVIIFAVLTAAYLGWIARREAGERREIERLHVEVSDQARDIETAYQRCREVQDDLVHSERLATIGRMSAEMAHQVRNPLSSISLNLELLEDEIASVSYCYGEESRALIGAIRQEIENLAGVTESYLRFAKLPPFRWEDVSLNDIVRDLTVFARPEIDRRGVVVSHRLDDDLPSVRVDRRQFKFALMSVFTNALDAMSGGGRLRIKTAAENGSAVLTIADTGEGIAREDLEKIFDPFFTTKQAGTGLGLSLTRRIVEAHGGRIACESIPQVGTTFSVSMPIDGHGDPEASDGRA